MNGDRRVTGGQPARAGSSHLPPLRLTAAPNRPDLKQVLGTVLSFAGAEPREKAVEMAREFFLRFGWKPSLEQLAEYQRELTERS
jgi:hypothetical protein